MASTDSRGGRQPEKPVLNRKSYKDDQKDKMANGTNRSILVDGQTKLVDGPGRAAGRRKIFPICLAPGVSEKQKARRMHKANQVTMIFSINNRCKQSDSHQKNQQNSGKHLHFTGGYMLESIMSKQGGFTQLTFGCKTSQLRAKNPGQ